MANIVDTAINASSFKTLLTVIQAAGLVDTLKNSGPFTIFLPTDDAFGNLPAGSIDMLLQDIPQLTKILKYHLVSGKMRAADLVLLDTVATVAGSTLAIDTVGDKLVVNTATVVKPDIEADNGVLHAIDKVLIPD